MGTNIGQGSLGFSPKEVTIPVPGPPFQPSSADNGLSVDAVTGRIVWGNDLGGTGAELLSDREIEMDNFLFRMMNGGPVANQLLIEPINGLYGFGDLGAVVGGSSLVLDDIARNVVLTTEIAGVPGQPFFAGNGISRVFQFGDTNNIANGLQLQLNDVANTVRIENLTELMLFFGPSVFSMGNVSDTLNGSKISIDDLNETFVFQTLTRMRTLLLEGFSDTQRMGDIDQVLSGLEINLDSLNSRARILTTLGAMLDFIENVAGNIYEFGDVDGVANLTKVSLDDANRIASINGSGRMLYLNNTLFQYRIGDIQPDANGTNLFIDDTTGEFRFDNTASNVSLTINGTAGFTGNVVAPASITVDGGIVTNVT